MTMDKYRDVTMFVCGLLVGVTVMAVFAPDWGKGKVPVTPVTLIKSDPGAKIPVADPHQSILPTPLSLRCKYLEEPCTEWVDSKTGAVVTGIGGGQYFQPR